MQQHSLRISEDSSPVTELSGCYAAFVVATTSRTARRRVALASVRGNITCSGLADQQCGAVREKVLNLDWPGFRTLSPAASNASSSDGHSTQGEESESEALVSEAAARYVPPYRREGNTSPCRTGRGCYDKGCITPGQFSDW